MTDLLDAADCAYVVARFVPLELLANACGWRIAVLREALSEGRIPKPTYVLPDGAEMVPPDYFPMIGDESQLGTLKERFVGRYEKALRRLKKSPSANDSRKTFEGFIRAGLGACLKSATPEAIALKHALIGRIEALLAAPQRGDFAWRSDLREQVSSLDALELPFARWDKMRFGGPVMRDRFIAAPRERYPEVFREGDS